MFHGIHLSMNDLGNLVPPTVGGLLHQGIKMKVPKWGKACITSRDFKTVLNHCSQRHTGWIQLLSPCLVYYYWTISMQIQSESFSFVSSHAKGRNCLIWVSECLRGYLIVSLLSPILWITQSQKVNWFSMTCVTLRKWEIRRRIIGTIWKTPNLEEKRRGRWERPRTSTADWSLSAFIFHPFPSAVLSCFCLVLPCLWWK